MVLYEVSSGYNIYQSPIWHLPFQYLVYFQKKDHIHHKDSYKTCLNTSTNYQATRNITDKLFAANITKTPLLFINDTKIDNSIINNQDKLFNFINDEIKRNN